MAGKSGRRKVASSSRKKPSSKTTAASKKPQRKLEGEFRKSVLANGVRVLTENHPISRAVSCGIWVNKGTRDELEHEAGLAHFVEHLVFKRTKRRNAYEISRDMEAVGGDLNAFTSREYTSFVTHSLKEDLGLSLDVLSDLVCRPSFDSGDIKKEKQVVVQEIHMSEDNLEDCIFDRYFEMVYPTIPLGKPILGTQKSIEGMKRETILDFHSRQYTAPNLMVSVAGNLDHDEVVAAVEKHLKPAKAAQLPAPVPGEAPEPEVFREVVKRPSEQAHILVGFPASDFRNRLRFESFIVNSILGGGLTSRLYQSVREERGLVYTIFSQLTTFVDTGLTLVYAGTSPKNAPTTVDLIVKEIKRLRKNGMTKAELEFFKKQVKGQILLGADDIDNRMNSLAINEMVLGRYRAVDEVMRDVEGVSFDSVHEYIERFVEPDKISMLLMGALPEAPTKKWLAGV